MVRNDFDQPIIAQWLRINPTRWADRISMRVELYGCEYIPDTLSFNGKSMIKLDLSRNPVASLRDTVRLRFKTNHESGVLLYSKGSQGDYIALQLVENRYIYLLSMYLNYLRMHSSNFCPLLIFFFKEVHPLHLLNS